MTISLAIDFVLAMTDATETAKNKKNKTTTKKLPGIVYLANLSLKLGGNKDV
jgi:hypothetical protein